MQTKVVNKHHGEPYDTYVGRGSDWGNPFSHLTNTKAQFKVATRDESVQKYKEWILTQPELLARLHELKGKTLCCYCKPQACHGDILAEMADALDQQTKTMFDSRQKPTSEQPNQTDEMVASKLKNGSDFFMENSSVIHIGFTGHRPTKLGGYNINTQEYKNLQTDLEIYIQRNLDVFDTIVCHSGLALGGDTIWSKAALSMKEKYPGRVLFHAEIPMLEQPNKWFKQSDIDFWHEQVKRADEQSIYGSLDGYSDAERKRLSGKFLNVRNEGMLGHSDVLLALHDGTAGGTGNAVKHAQKTNLVTHTVHPNIYFA